jgi:S-methylmethionine-dependent homocysteine/selenocysteine methylase
LSAEEYLILAQAWRDMGATIIGGCCGIGPDHIALMNTKLR